MELNRQPLIRISAIRIMKPKRACKCNFTDQRKSCGGLKKAEKAVRRYGGIDAIYARHLPDVEPEDTRQHATSFLIQYSLPQAKDCRQQLEQQQVSTSPTKGLTDNKNTSKTVRLTAGCCGSRYVVAFFCITNQIISFWR